MGTSAAIYARISKDRAQEGLGVERQERECRALCDRLNLAVVAVYVDNDLSAYTGRRRPGFEAMKEAMKNGEFDTLVAWHPDRLTRQVRELEDLIELIEVTGVAVQTVGAGEYRLDTSAGRQIARILGAVARGESEHKAERLRSKLDELAAAGKPSAGRPPYGYRREFPDRARDKGRQIIDEREAKILRWMADEVFRGRSLLSLARELNARGVPIKQGKRPEQRWHHSTIQKILLNPAAAGLRVHRREVAGEGDWEPIFDRATWDQLCATVADPARKRTRPANKFMLTGLVQSATGDRMNGTTTREGARAYATKGGPTGPPKTPTQVNADKVEAFITEMVLVALANWRPAEAAAPEGQSEVVAIERELVEIARLRGERVISMEEWLAARRPLEAALKEAKAKVLPARPRARILEAPNIHEAWANAEVEQRRQVIAAVVDHVTVLPTKRGRWATMEERVRIVWRA